LIPTRWTVKARRVLSRRKFTSKAFFALAVVSRLRGLVGSSTILALLARVTLGASSGACSVCVFAYSALVATVKARLRLELATRTVPALVLASFGLPLASGALCTDDATLVCELALWASKRLVACPMLRILVAVVATITDGVGRALYAVMAALVRTPIVGIGAARHSSDRFHQRRLCHGQGLRRGIDRISS
jgi:hypothetical protein